MTERCRDNIICNIRVFNKCGRVFSVALPVVSGLELYDVTQSTMRVRWWPTEGASGYMLVYAPLSSETTDETEVRNQLDMYM